MRILRSHYLQYQGSVTKTTTLTAYKKLDNDEPNFTGTVANDAARRSSATSTKTTTIAKVATSSGGEVKFMGPPQRRQSIYQNPTLLSMPTFCKSITHAQQQQQQNQPKLYLNFQNISTTTTRRINIVLHFYNEETRWYTQIYRNYENLVWRRIPRNSLKKGQRWYFKCRICKKLMCSFESLKGHLNGHMEFYPHRCDHCSKKYASRSSLSKHAHKYHLLEAAMLTYGR